MTERKYYDGDYYRNIKYTLDGDRVIKQEIERNGIELTAYYMYDESGRSIAFALSENGGANEYYFYESNIFGDITAIYDEDGNVVASYKYDAWGNFTAATSKNYFFTDASLFKYRGYIYDWDTGFYYLQSRYYDPEVGRFINADGYINANGDLLGFNMYAYCGNNPIMYIDNMGDIRISQRAVDRWKKFIVAISAWSPSYSFNVFGFEIQIGAEVGAVGGSFNLDTGGISAKGALGGGISIGISW